MQLDIWSDIMQLMEKFSFVMVISMYIDISFSNVIRLYCCHSMQLATIVSMLVYTYIHLCATLNLCSRMRTTVQRDKPTKKFKDIYCRKRSHCCDTVRVKSQ